MYSTQLKSSNYSYSSAGNGAYYGPSSSVSQTTSSHKLVGGKWVPLTQDNNESRMQKYTNLYHHYTAAATGTNSDTNAVVWAKYHADLACRAAHYFHQNPTVTTLPPSMKLPPDVETSATTPVTSRGSTTDGMQRYVQRCMENGNMEKKAAADLAQAIIQKELKSGKNLHSISWDTQPVPSSGKKRKGETTSNIRSIGKSNTTTSYYGNNAAETNYYGLSGGDKPRKGGQKSKNKTFISKKRRTAASTNGAHYGPSATSTNQSSQAGFDQSSNALNRRAARFGTTETKKSSSAYSGLHGGSNKVLDAKDYERMTVKGKCKVLEKDYLRLTAPPRPEFVRPLRVLRQHLRNLQASTSIDYLWLCSQLKAMRQDCTVQRIQCAFAVEVYETHARLALQYQDMNEFNQCQTQLGYLYDHLEGDALDHRPEFLAYRILYQVFVWIQGSASLSDVLPVMASALPYRKDPHVQHALLVRQACAVGNYHSFFVLYGKCPTPSSKRLMEGMVPTMRYRALQVIVKGYRPSTVPLDFVCRQLGMKDGREWLESCGCVILNGDLVTKESDVHESTLEIKQTLI